MVPPKKNCIFLKSKIHATGKYGVTLKLIKNNEPVMFSVVKIHLVIR